MTIVSENIKPFKIFAGHPRGKAIIGFLERGDRSRLSADSEAYEVSDFPGKEMFPNVFNAWGRRIAVDKDGKRKAGNADPNDIEYKGDIEFLEYGDSKGSLIQCRYVPGHKTLDYNYQVMKLGLPKYNTQEGQMYNYMDVQKGETEITVSDPAYAVMMKIHPMNKNSICRSPNTENHQWHEINELDSEKILASTIDAEFEAISIVKSAATSGKKLNILFNLIGGDSVIKWDKSDEGSKYEGMVVFAKQNPDLVTKALAKFKEEVQAAIAKGESYDAFDLSVKGVVKVKKGDSKVVLLSDIPASGKNMLTWIWENAMEPNVFDAYGKLVSYAENNFK